MLEDDSINKLAEKALNLAVAHIQKELSVPNGDLASHFFSNGVVVGLLEKYIDEEIYFNVLNKNQMIEALINDDLHDVAPNTIHRLLREGFIGYQNQTEEELKAELTKRFQ
jgi:hypothetical protein